MQEGLQIQTTIFWQFVCWRRNNIVFPGLVPLSSFLGNPKSPGDCFCLGILKAGSYEFSFISLRERGKPLFIRSIPCFMALT